MIRDKKIILQDVDFVNIIEDILANEKVQEMKKYRQHHKINGLDHCLFVSYNAYIICKKHDLDYISTARAAMVHDLFLYDWRKRENGRKGLHAFTHPHRALEIASSFLELNDKEKDIILKHMWPVTFKIPKYKESFIVSFVDKCFAVEESFIKVEECEKEKVIK